MSPSVVGIELDGPGGAGLEPLELDPASFQSAVPTQHHFEYFSSEIEGLDVGVWDTTTMQEVFASYPTDEFIVVFEGAFELVDEKGPVANGLAGPTAFIHGGTSIRWKHAGYLKKVHDTLRALSGGVPAQAGSNAKTSIIEPFDNGVAGSDGAFDPDDRFLVGGADGRMTLWKIESKAKHLPISSFSSHQFIHVLDGAPEQEPPTERSSAWMRDKRSSSPAISNSAGTSRGR